MIQYCTNSFDETSVKFDWNLNIGQDWALLLEDLIESDYSNDLVNFIDQVYLSKEDVFPVRENLFRSFICCPLKDTKVVVIDNRPCKTIKSSGIGRGINSESGYVSDLPLELRNFRDCIYETIFGNQNSINHFDCSLNDYSNEGLLFLNASMCVTEDRNYKIVWRNFIRTVIFELNKRKENIVYLFLTGENSDLIDSIDEDKNKIIVNPTNVLMSYSKIFIELDEFMEEKYHPTSLISW